MPDDTDQPFSEEQHVTTVADELRAAADKLRALATTATPGPWVTTWRGQEYQLDGDTESDLGPIAEWTYAIATVEPKASEHRAECDTANADYIAAMGPNVGALLADWLEAEGQRLAATHPGWQETVVSPPALAAPAVSVPSA